MKKILIVFLFLLANVFSSAAQTRTGGGGGGAGSVTSGAGAPSGSCTSTALYVNSSNGNLYSCNAGAWVAVSSGGSGTVTSVATTSPITGGTITTTGTVACATCTTAAASIVSGDVVTGAGLQAVQDSGTLLTALAALASPTFTGTPAAPTAAVSTNTTQLATTAFVLAQAAAPGPIGSTTASTGAFTTLSASSTVSGTGFSTYLASPPAIGGTAAAAGTFTTLTGKTSVTAGVVGTTAGVLNLSGSTSGTANCTAPAVAGTTSNFVTCSNSLQISSTVSGGTPQLTFNDGTSGWQQSAAGVWKYYGAGTDTLALAANILRVNSSTGYQFSSSSSSSGTPDTGLGRSAAGILSADTGTIGNGLGTYIASAYQTKTNCSSSASPAVCGSAAAGSVVIAASASTVVVNTTAVTANSQIFVFPDETLGTKLSVTCNSTLATAASGLAITARTAGTSFTISTLATVATNPVCLSYHIIN